MVKEWICKEEPLIRADGTSVGIGFRQMTELIRCKDCKHRPTVPDGITYGDGFDLKFPEGSKCPCQCLDDGYYSWYPEDDWFCADGERKDGDGDAR